MATGMVTYEAAVASTKRRLFDALLPTLRADAVVLELGIGSFPNAPFYDAARVPLDVIGVDPNDSMEAFALQAAAPLLRAGSSVRVVHGVAEALPFTDGSIDAVACTLTLCSVPSPAAALAEVSRVLRPGGKLLFLEHVLSETDPKLRALQRAFSPLQVESADGCHLDRRTLETIRAAGFASVDAQYFELQDFLYLNPTVAGIATLSA